MIIDYVKSVTGRIFTMNNAEPAPEGPKKLFDQVKFQVVLSEGWSVVDITKVLVPLLPPASSRLTFTPR